MSSQDSENLRVCYEGIIKHNPNNAEAVYFLAVWHLERQSFQQARRYFGHLATLREDDPEVWLCLCVCCALAEEFHEAVSALSTAKRTNKSPEGEVRIRFCQALIAEKRRDFPSAMEGYTLCLNQCSAMANQINSEQAQRQTQTQTHSHSQMYSQTHTQTQPHSQSAFAPVPPTASSSSSSAATVTTTPPNAVVAPLSTEEKEARISFIKEVRGEVMLRIAMLKKEMGALDQAMAMCATIASGAFSDAVRANALCLKGLLLEMGGDFPASEVVYRSVLQLKSDHCIALERLGRVYLRYRETIPAAVQCFFKAVETNPSNHIAWYLLGRCYMATSQYSDACEAYNRAVNLHPNDPQIWCSLGVLYYAFGQYKEALGMFSRALKLDPSMADAWYNVGALYDMCDQPEDAQQAYIKAKEHGLADRFAQAGLGMNPVAMQSLQYVQAAVQSAVQQSSSAADAPSSSSAAQQNSEGVHKSASLVPPSSSSVSNFTNMAGHQISHVNGVAVVSSPPGTTPSLSTLSSLSQSAHRDRMAMMQHTLQEQEEHDHGEEEEEVEPALREFVDQWQDEDDV